MSDPVFPTLNVAPVMQGLKDLGEGLQQANNIQDSIDATKATMQLNASWNDQINQLKQSGDYSGDWGEQQRDFVQQNIAGQAGNFSSPRAYAQWAAQQGLAYEQHIPAVRQLQTVAQSNYCSSQTVDLGTTAADKASGQDLSGIKDFNTWAGTMANGTNVSFSPSYLAGFRNADGQIDTSKAHQAWQKVQDQTAGQYVGAQLDDIMNNSTQTSAQKLQAVQGLQNAAFQTLQSNNVYFSSGMRKGLETQMSDAQAKLTAAAQAENTSNWMTRIDQAAESDTPSWESAKLTGGGFEPTTLNALAKQSDQMPAAALKYLQEKEQGMTMEMKEGGAAEKLSKLQTEALGQNVLTYIDQASNQGMPTAQLINELQPMMGDLAKSGATIDGKPISWNTIQQHIQSNSKTFATVHPDVVSAVDATLKTQGFTADAFPGQYDSLRVQLLADAGGANTVNGRSQFLKSDGVTIDTQALQAYATTAVNEAKTQTIKQIVSSIGGSPGFGVSQADWNTQETAAAVRSLQVGKGAGAFTQGDIGVNPRTGVSSNQALSVLTTQLQKLASQHLNGQQVKATYYDPGVQFGLPMFLVGGKWVQPFAGQNSDVIGFKVVDGPNVSKILQGRR